MFVVRVHRFLFCRQNTPVSLVWFNVAVLFVLPHTHTRTRYIFFKIINIPKLQIETFDSQKKVTIEIRDNLQNNIIILFRGEGYNTHNFVISLD